MEGFKMNKHMRGMSIMTVFLIVILVVFFSSMAVKLLPSYFEYYQVKDSLDLMSKDPEIKRMANQKIKNNFMTKLQMNNVRGISFDSLSIERDHEKLWLNLKYEKKIHLMGNIDALLSFDDRVMASESNEKN